MGEERRRSRGSALYQAHQAHLGLDPAHSAVPGGAGEQEPEHSNRPYGAIAPYAEQGLDGAALLYKSGAARYPGRGSALGLVPSSSSRQKDLRRSSCGLVENKRTSGPWSRGVRTRRADEITNRHLFSAAGGYFRLGMRACMPRYGIPHHRAGLLLRRTAQAARGGASRVIFRRRFLLGLRARGRATDGEVGGQRQGLGPS